MKRLVSIHLFETKAKICARCGMDNHQSEGCCRDEVKVVKLQQDQNKLIYGLPGIAKLSVPVIETSEFIVSPFTPFISTRYFQNHSPPLLSAQNTYLLNNVFRI